MSVDSTTRKQEFTMDGSTVDFEFSFKVLLGGEEDIKCSVISSAGTITALTYSTDYTVVINSNGDGGTVTVSDAQSSTDTLFVYRDTTDTQESVYNDYNQFPADSVEADFDRRTMRSQESDDAISRAVKFNITSDISDIEYPTPSAGQVLVWADTNGTLVNSDFAVVSAYTFGDITIRSKATVAILDAGVATIGNLTITTNATVANATIAALTVTTINVSSGTIAGAVTGVTQSAKDNSTKLATTAYVDATATESETFGSLTVKTQATIAMAILENTTAATVNITTEATIEMAIVETATVATLNITTEATIAVADIALATIGTLVLTGAMDAAASTVTSLLVTTSATIAIADIGLATVGSITVKTTATITDIDITGGEAAALTVSNIDISAGNATTLTISNIEITAGLATALTVSNIEITAGVMAGMQGVADALTISNIEISAGLADAITITDVDITDGIAAALTVSNIDITAGDATSLTVATLDVTTRAIIELATIATLTVTTKATIEVADIGLATMGTLTITTQATIASFTAPLQPSFIAILSGTQNNVTGDGTLYTLTGAIFTEIEDRGGNFSNGTFTAPITGTYGLGITYGLLGVAAAHNNAEIVIVTSNRSYRDFFNSANVRVAATGSLVRTLFVVADMDAADTFTVTIELTNGTKVIDVDSTHTRIWGYLIH